MKRLPTSALLLALAIPLAACGGSGEPAKDGSDPPAGEKDAGDDDPVAAVQKQADDLQAAVDAVFQPLKDADAVFDSVGKLGADLKAAKSKVDAKKVLAEIKKVAGGGEAALDALKMDDAGKPIVQERVDKVKALFANIKDLDAKIADLTSKIGDAVPKIAANVGKAIAKLELKLKNPLLKGDDKKKAEDDKAKINALKDGFTQKAADWKKQLTDLPTKAKDIPTKFAALK